jgi:hypothetical protein
MPEDVHERYLEIRTVPEQQVITVIEIVSPSNKLSREGREQYESKRLKVLGSLTHLVEIDLLRAGQPLPMKVPSRNDYRILVSRSQHRPSVEPYRPPPPAATPPKLSSLSDSAEKQAIRALQEGTCNQTSCSLIGNTYNTVSSSQSVVTETC